MGFKSRKKTREELLKEALDIALEALDLYGEYGNWGVVDHNHCYDCHCPLYRDVFIGTDYEDGNCPAERAAEDIRELLKE